MEIIHICNFYCPIVVNLLWWANYCMLELRYKFHTHWIMYSLVIDLFKFNQHEYK